ncbi:GyrI-like domain-containing protein [Roseburia hominis]
MEYRIETKEAFRIVGVSIPLSKEMEKNFETIPNMWAKAASDGTLEKLAGMMDARLMGILGVSACDKDEPWKYFIAAASSKEDDALEEYMVPAGTWAIFAGSGTNLSIQQLEQEIFTKWLLASEYEYGNGPDMEVYLNPDPENAQFEVWIPVRKK